MDKKIFQELRIKEKEIRKLAIVEVAESILHEKGIEAVTIRNVAEEAGLKSGPMYAYSAGGHIYGYQEDIARLRTLKSKML